MKEILDRLDPWQTHTYLNTSRDFEQIFNLDEPLQDKNIFVHKIEEFNNKIMAKDYSAKSGSKIGSPTETMEKSPVDQEELPPY